MQATLRVGFARNFDCLSPSRPAIVNALHYCQIYPACYTVNMSDMRIKTILEHLGIDKSCSQQVSINIWQVLDPRIFESGIGGQYGAPAVFVSRYCLPLCTLASGVV